ncbi:MAG: TlpA family protein disulfide reductase [Syntrophobacterales bacterium]|nr:TlpA family protein disulfide reductase [Syntrophobacterales bacterium]
MSTRHKTGIYFLTFFSIVIFISFSCPAVFSQDKWNIREQSIENLAPDFALQDLTGEEIKLSDYKGKVALINFSTTWCPHCRAITPYLKKLHLQYKDRGLIILNVDIQESRERVNSFALKYGLTYKVLLDESGEVARTYGIRGVPTLILVNKEGKIVCRQCRSVDLLVKTLLAP